MGRTKTLRVIITSNPLDALGPTHLLVELAADIAAFGPIAAGLTR